MKIKNLIKFYWLVFRNNYLIRNYLKNVKMGLIKKIKNYKKCINIYICMLVVYGGGNNLEVNFL